MADPARSDQLVDKQLKRKERALTLRILLGVAVGGLVIGVIVGFFLWQNNEETERNREVIRSFKTEVREDFNALLFSINRFLRTGKPLPDDIREAVEQMQEGSDAGRNNTSDG